MKPGAVGSTLAAALLAVALPAAVFWLATPIELRTAEVVISPFGWPRILVTHLLAALPLSFFLAHWLHRVRRTRHDVMEVGKCVGLGILTAALSLSWGADVGRALTAARPTFEIRVAARALWCVVLQLPWCLLGLCLLRGPTPSLLSLPRWLTGGLALVTALVLPAVYTTTLVEEQGRRLKDLVGRGRWLRAQRSIVGLDDLTPPPELAGTVAYLHKSVAQPLQPDAPLTAVVQRARMLAALDRLDEARRLVLPLADADPDGGLLLAAIDQDQHNWAASSAAYRAVLQQLAKRPVSDKNKLCQVEAFDGLAFNAREQQDYASAIAIYQEALTSVPGAEAYYHFQLGRQLHQAGCPAEALHHLQTASQLCPEPYSKLAAPLINDIRTNTVSCFLTWTQKRP